MPPASPFQSSQISGRHREGDMSDPVNKKKVVVTKAPPPPHDLRGSYISPQPKPAVPPDHLPAYYPQNLIPKTNVIIHQGVKKFRDRTQLVELCRYVIAEMTAHVGE